MSRLAGVVLLGLLACSGPTAAPVPRERTVLCLGDSITSGQAVERPYPDTLKNLLGHSWRVINAGVWGETSTQIRDRWSSSLVGWQIGVVVLLAGTNDLQAQNRTAEEIALNLQAIYDEALSEGMRVVPVTVLPFRGWRAWTSSIELQRTKLNAWILEYCSLTGVECVDAASQMDDGTGALRPEFDGGDHLHPSQAGTDRLAELVRSAFPD
ncbi:SGNH/GDSL hydrolase family protein [Anaeromyxobacter sp. SG26]|uniref:SGNH/GDSL hydrolase family protein n=1 Tax=Anaeromyxobacter sp. SG26 TaxID=2925407 RepID=UPI001F582718|nr:GDSL-type esterase/lipase family protein [Anaeromyxobacter sp. SG26]